MTGTPTFAGELSTQAFEDFLDGRLHRHGWRVESTECLGWIGTTGTVKNRTYISRDDGTMAFFDWAECADGSPPGPASPALRPATRKTIEVYCPA